jgi:CheY-like chemotaxis protein
MTQGICKVTNLSTYKHGYNSNNSSNNNNDNLYQNYYPDNLRNLLLSEQLVLQQQQKNQAAISKIKAEQEKEKGQSNLKQILVIDDNPDITITFKNGLEAENYKSGNKVFFKVYIYNDTISALADFKPNFYDLALIDINMPKINGFKFSELILELDLNIRICYITAAEINQKALREQFPTLSIGCYIKKPVEIEYLVRRVKAELE